MSTSAIGPKWEIKLPTDICLAAGIQVSDTVEWRFEQGEIRGRKKQADDVVEKRLVRPEPFKDLLVLPQDIEVDWDRVTQEMKEDRERGVGAIAGDLISLAEEKRRRSARTP
jgi:hypothetical protein